MDNQQERPRSLDFIGGLITGEGCFSFVITRNRKRGMISPAFQIFMADKETMEIAYTTLKSNNLPGYFETRKPQGNSRPLCGIRCHGVKSLKRLCEVLLPHLYGDKREAAMIVKEFCDHRLSLGPKAGYSPKDVDFVRRLRETNGQAAQRRIALDELPGILRDYTLDIAR